MIYIIEKIYIFVKNHYQLHGYKKRKNYLKFHQTSWNFLNLNLDEIYNIITCIL